MKAKYVYVLVNGSGEEIGGPFDSRADAHTVLLDGDDIAVSAEGSPGNGDGDAPYFVLITLV